MSWRGTVARWALSRRELRRRARKSACGDPTAVKNVGCERGSSSTRRADENLQDQGGGPSRVERAPAPTSNNRRHARLRGAGVGRRRRVCVGAAARRRFTSSKTPLACAILAAPSPSKSGSVSLVQLAVRAISSCTRRASTCLFRVITGLLDAGASPAPVRSQSRRAWEIRRSRGRARANARLRLIDACCTFARSARRTTRPPTIAKSRRRRVPLDDAQLPSTPTQLLRPLARKAHRSSDDARSAPSATLLPLKVSRDLRLGSRRGDELQVAILTRSARATSR